jgi:hypothetical protein
MAYSEPPKIEGITPEFTGWAKKSPAEVIGEAG